MKFVCVNPIQNLQRQILAMLEQVAILNVKIFSLFFLYTHKQEQKEN